MIVIVYVLSTLMTGRLGSESLGTIERLVCLIIPKSVRICPSNESCVLLSISFLFDSRTPVLGDCDNDSGVLGTFAFRLQFLRLSIDAEMDGLTHTRASTLRPVS